jgi:hypothetical protein
MRTHEARVFMDFEDMDQAKRCVEELQGHVWRPLRVQARFLNRNSEEDKEIIETAFKVLGVKSPAVEEKANKKEVVMIAKDRIRISGLPKGTTDEDLQKFLDFNLPQQVLMISPGRLLIDKKVGVIVKLKNNNAADILEYYGSDSERGLFNKKANLLEFEGGHILTVKPCKPLRARITYGGNSPDVVIHNLMPGFDAKDLKQKLITVFRQMGVQGRFVIIKRTPEESFDNIVWSHSLVLRFEYLVDAELVVKNLGEEANFPFQFEGCTVRVERTKQHVWKYHEEL